MLMHKALALHPFDQILVTIEHIYGRIIIQSDGKSEQCIGLEEVIMIQEADEITFRLRDANSCIARDPTILGKGYRANPAIAHAILRHLCRKRRILWRSIGQDQLQPIISLTEHRIHHVAKVLDRGAEQRHHDAEA